MRVKCDPTVWFPVSNNLFGIDGLNDKKPPGEVPLKVRLWYFNEKESMDQIKHNGCCNKCIDTMHKLLVLGIRV